MRIALESANQPEALALYECFGYKRRVPFGSYTDDPNSVFMHKPAPAALDSTVVEARGEA